jgi:hypothetical protein
LSWRVIRHFEKAFFKTTITQYLTTVRGWRSRHYYVTPTTTTSHNSQPPLHNSCALPSVHELFKWPSCYHPIYT